MAFDKLNIEHECLVGIIVSIEVQVSLVHTDQLFAVKDDLVPAMFVYRHKFCIVLVFILCRVADAQLLLGARVGRDSDSTARHAFFLGFGSPQKMIEDKFAVSRIKDRLWI